jgi:hypothetical protein
MTNICTITPDRGDRKGIIGFTLSRLTQAYQITVLYEPTSEAIDIVPRIKYGIDVAKRHGCEYAYIIESDDYYPKDYFQQLTFEDYDFIGYSDTIYYNINSRTYQYMEHPERSSLFCTGFKISALDGFNWDSIPEDYKWLDIKLWEYANRTDKKIKLLRNNTCLGIKGHGQGKYAGKGHTMLLKNSDPDLSFLKARVDEEAFKFYGDLMKRV